MSNNVRTVQGTMLHLATVSYCTPCNVISAFLDSIRLAFKKCQEVFPDVQIKLTIVDNSRCGQDAPKLDSLAKKCLGKIPFQVISGHGNIGYGAGLNLALLGVGSHISIASNPDIIVERDALLAVVSIFQRYPSAGVISPCFLVNGKSTHLCKRVPSMVALLARRLPRLMKPAFRAILDSYQMADCSATMDFWNPPVATGAFMAFRTEVLTSIGGFDEKYFLYFEDFDVSIRAQRTTNLRYSPEVRVRHVQYRVRGYSELFTITRSAFRFWRQHGFVFIHPSKCSLRNASFRATSPSSSNAPLNIDVTAARLDK